MIHIDKITLAVEHMDAVKQFYSHVFEVSFHPMMFAGRELFAATLGSMELLLCPKDLAGVDASINTVQLRFVLDNVEGAYERGMAHGGIALTEPQEREGRMHASLRDPDRNSLELIAPLV